MYTSMSMCEKRKHKTLTLSEKAEIIRRIDNGEKLIDLAALYGVGRATVYDIRKNRDKIVGFMRDNDGAFKERKTLKLGGYPQVEEAVYKWFIQEVDNNNHISGEIIRDKARIIYKEIMNRDDFRASEGWLDKFKKRYGIRALFPGGGKLQYEIGSVNTSVGDDFIDLDQMTVTNNSEAALEEEFSNDEKLPEVVDMLQPMRIKEEILELEDFVDVDNSYQEEPTVVSELQDQDTERNICESSLELKEPKLPVKEKSSEKGNAIIRLMGVVSKLESVSDQIAAATFGDSYDQFGKYIATLLRGLPQRTVISLKQQMVQAVLNVKFAEEQNESMSETPNELQKSSVVSPLHKSSDKTKFASVKTLADNSHHLSASLQHQMISENIDTSFTFTDRPSASTLATCGTSSTPSCNLTGEVSNLSTITDIDTNSQKLTIPHETPNSGRTLLLDQMPLGESESTSHQPFTLHQKTELDDHCPVPKQPKLLSNKKACKYGAEQQSKPSQKQFLLSKEAELLVSTSNTEVPKILQINRKENPKTYSKKAKMSNSDMNSEDDFSMDIEENEELANIKQKQDGSFETIFCDSLFELKQEPPDNEEDHYMSGDSSHHS